MTTVPNRYVECRSMPPPIAENIEAAIERILSQTLTHQRGQAVVGFAQIGRRAGQEDRRGG